MLRDGTEIKSTQAEIDAVIKRHKKAFPIWQATYARASGKFLADKDSRGVSLGDFCQVYANLALEPRQIKAIEIQTKALRREKRANDPNLSKIQDSDSSELVYDAD